MNGINLNVLKYFPIMPDQASNEAVTFDLLYWWITALAVFFGGIVVLMTVWFATKYRRGSKADRRNPIDHSKPLEALFIGVPTVLALVTFWWSTAEFVHVRTMPKENKEIFVIGKQWMWHLQHMNGMRENNELHIPVDTNIKFTMISQDVIHAFYLPEFRAQYHVVPGRYTEMWIRPTKTGRFRLLCAMHCGTQHSEMVGYVYVMSKQEYAKWQETGGNRFESQAMTMAEAGKKVWNSKGCGNCHTNMDTFRGPTLVGIYNKTRQLEDGTAVANTEYLRDSIMTPWRRISKGYDPTMPAYAGQLSEEDALNLIEYLKGTSNMSVPGQKMPYEPTSPGTNRMGPSGPRNAANLANENASAGMTQSQQGGYDEK